MHRGARYVSDLSVARHSGNHLLYLSASDGELCSTFSATRRLAVCFEVLKRFLEHSADTNNNANPDLKTCIPRRVHPRVRLSRTSNAVFAVVASVLVV